MADNIYYDGTKLLNMRDINGDRPEIYIVDGNRSSGKTTYFYRYLVNRFLKFGEKFALIYRFQNELKGCSDQFFGNIGPLFFPGHDCTEEKRQEGAFYELYIDNNSAGYAIALNNPDKIKKLSHFFIDVQRMYFDEFQGLRYTPDEVAHLISLHTSIARAPNKPVRYVPVYMSSNHISSLNPYYKAFHVAGKIDSMREGYFKGDGFVIEKNMNDEVANLQKQSPFLRAFSSSDEVRHTIENISSLDNYGFIEKIKTSNFEYLCNIKVDDEMISLKAPRDVKGVRFYFDRAYDPNMKERFAIDTSGHSDDTILIGGSSVFIMKVKQEFERGRVRFADLETKEKAFEFLMLTW